MEGNVLKFIFPRLQPAHYYTAYCAAVEIPVKNCNNCSGMVQLQPLTFSTNATVAHVNFTTVGATSPVEQVHKVASSSTGSDDGDDDSRGGGVIALLVLFTIAAVGALGGFAFVNRKGLSRRYWARQVVLNREDRELVSTSINAESLMNFTELGDGLA